jgi:hypothetical protein
VARSAVYGQAFLSDPWTRLGEHGAWGAVLAASGAAFAGAWAGSRLIGKVTLLGVRRLVGWMLLLLGTGLATGAI